MDETASELGLTSEQVWYRQHRLLKKLRARMTLYTGAALGPQDEEWPDGLLPGEA